MRPVPQIELWLEPNVVYWKLKCRLSCGDREVISGRQVQRVSAVPAAAADLINQAMINAIKEGWIADVLPNPRRRR